MDFLLRTWPTWLGTIVLVAVGYFIWPQEKTRPEPRLVATSETVRQDQTAAQPGMIDDTSPHRSRVGILDSDGKTSSDAPRQFVDQENRDVGQKGQELEPDSRAAQQALQSVDIEIFKADWCPRCREAIAYFKHNNLSYKVHDVQHDAEAKEKAKRLSGRTAIPVILVDGQVGSGFSESSMQRRLSAAVARRMRQ